MAIDNKSLQRAIYAWKKKYIKKYVQQQFTETETV